MGSASQAGYSKYRRLVSVIIPAYNEEKSISSVVSAAKDLSAKAIVVDDCSTDQTGLLARKAGALVVRHKRNLGYLEALRTGFRIASKPIVVILDADGQYDADDIPRLVKPILEGEADLVVGSREKIGSFSETLLTKLTNLRVKISDASSSYKAIKSEIARKMRLNGRCICGSFLLEAAELGAKIREVKVASRERKFGRSRTRKEHLWQTLIVLKQIFHP
ncbi:MAG: glycosyltransferase family 2 protein [Candidatus Bathyarchaeia archaeon]